VVGMLASLDKPSVYPKPSKVALQNRSHRIPTTQCDKVACGKYAVNSLKRIGSIGLDGRRHPGFMPYVP